MNARIVSPRLSMDGDCQSAARDTRVSARSRSRNPREHARNLHRRNRLVESTTSVAGIVPSFQLEARMRVRRVSMAVFLFSLLWVQGSHAAEPTLIAIGSVSGLYEDFATQTTAPLANKVPGNRLGGIGSGLTFLGDDWFL